MKKLTYVISALLISLNLVAQAQKDTSVSPHSSGKIDGKVIAPNREVVKPPLMDYQLRVEKISTARLSKETKIGQEGDILLIIEGGGFVATSLNPTVIIGKNQIEETIISLDFKKLYVVLTKELLNQLERSAFEKVEVRNPGKGSATIDYKFESIQKSLTEDTRPVALVYDEKGIVLR